MKYTKTNKMAQIIQFPGGCRIERRIYEDVNGIEMVKVNGEWTELDWYDCHKNYIVHRFW